KSTLKQLVLSATYRQDSAHSHPLSSTLPPPLSLLSSSSSASASLSSSSSFSSSGDSRSPSCSEEKGSFLLRGDNRRFSLSPRGASGESAGERGPPPRSVRPTALSQNHDLDSADFSLSPRGTSGERGSFFLNGPGRR